MKNWTISLCLLLAVALMFPSPAMAKGVTYEDTVEEGEVVDHNMVLAGPIVVMDGKIEGDLMAIGDQVTINGEVDGNLVAIGNKVILNGSVAGSVYVGAATLVFGPQASIGRDVSFIGGMLETQETTSIARDLNLLSLDAEVTGTAGREVNALVGPMRVVLLVYEFFQNQGWLPQTQNLDLQFSRAGSVRQGALGMGFGLSSVQSLTRISSALASEPGLQPPEQQGTVTAEQWQEWGVTLLRNIGALLIVGLLAIWLLPAQLHWTSEQPRIRPWRSFLIGLIVLLLGWFVALLALLLVLGLSFFLFWLSLPNLGFLVVALGLLAIGLALVLYWLSIVFFSKVIVAFLVGRLLLARLMPRYAHSRIGALLTGVILYALLASIPYLGWVIAVFTTLFGLGALWIVGTSSPRLEKGEPAPVLQPADDNLNVGLPAG